MKRRKNLVALLLCCALLLSGMTALAEDAPTMDEFLGTWKLSIVAQFDAEGKLASITTEEENDLPEDSIVIEPEELQWIQAGQDPVVATGLELGIDDSDGQHYIHGKSGDADIYVYASDDLSEMVGAPVISMKLFSGDGTPFILYFKLSGDAEASDAGEAAEPDVVYTDKDTVKQVQKALNDAGYNCGTPDGVAGKKTAAAISQYQTDKGLEVTGTVTGALVEALGIGKAPEATAEPEQESQPQDDAEAAASDVGDMDDPNVMAKYYNDALKARLEELGVDEEIGQAAYYLTRAQIASAQKQGLELNSEKSALDFGLWDTPKLLIAIKLDNSDGVSDMEMQLTFLEHAALSAMIDTINRYFKGSDEELAEALKILGDAPAQDGTVTVPRNMSYSCSGYSGEVYVLNGNECLLEGKYQDQPDNSLEADGTDTDPAEDLGTEEAPGTASDVGDMDDPNVMAKYYNDALKARLEELGVDEEIGQAAYNLTRAQICVSDKQGWELVSEKSSLFFGFMNTPTIEIEIKPDASVDGSEEQIQLTFLEHAALYAMIDTTNRYLNGSDEELAEALKVLGDAPAQDGTASVTQGTSYSCGEYSWDIWIYAHNHRYMLYAELNQ